MSGVLFRLTAAQVAVIQPPVFLDRDGTVTGSSRPSATVAGVPRPTASVTGAARRTGQISGSPRTPSTLEG